MERICDKVKIDTALTPVSLNGAGTGEYFRMDLHRKALFVVNVGAMAAGKTSEIQVMQAQDAAGTGAKVVASSTATITANTNVQAALLTSSATHVAEETYTVNGLVFTAASADVPGTRTYAIGANAAASTANLAAKINDETIGVPGVLAVAADGVLTLTADEPGETSITLAASAGAKGVPSTARAVAYVEVDAENLDTNNGYTHVAVRLTNSAEIVSGAVLLRGQSRYSANQVVAASQA
jgi:hypothetical protein